MSTFGSLRSWVLELLSDRRWNRSFARSADRLAELADAARREHQAGSTVVLGECLSGERQRLD